MKRIIPLLAALVSVAAPVGAQTIISVNLHDFSGPTMLNTDSAGVVAATNWTNVNDGGASYGATDLRNDLGAATTTDLTITASTDTSKGPSGAGSTSNGTAGDRTMMDGTAGSSTDQITLSLRDLPTAFATTGVDIYLYSWGLTQAGGSSEARYSGLYQYELDADGAGAGGFVDAAFSRNYDPAAGNQNWPGFTNNQFATQAAVTAGSSSSYVKISIAGGFDATNGFDIRLGNIAEGGAREILQGFQIVQVPEPGTAMMLIGGVGSLLLLRRRRQ